MLPVCVNNYVCSILHSRFYFIFYRFYVFSGHKRVNSGAVEIKTQHVTSALAAQTLQLACMQLSCFSIGPIRSQ